MPDETTVSIPEAAAAEQAAPAAPAEQAPVAQPAEPVVAAPPDRELAWRFVVKFTGQPETAARSNVDGCIDSEVADIIVAGGDRATAADQINDVLNRAYDRRREAAAVEATKAEASARRSGLALAKLQASGKTADESAKALASMTPEQIDELLAGS
jgi:hypothetical protein